MSSKELAIETIRDLPENATWREIEERIQFMAGIEAAREQVRRGEVVPHEEVRELLSQWISE